MKIDDLIKHYPRLYHMAESGTWESIREHGLLSTSALLDLFEINGKERREIEDQHRPELVPITHNKYGRAVVRDQKPMRESSLLNCLTKPLTPRDWYRILNRNVFFWLDSRRLNGLLGAKPYRNKRHCVLTVDSGHLITAYEKEITLSPMNSGSTLYDPLSRGLETFLPIAEFPFEKRRATRPIQNTVVELLVKYAVPNVDEFVLKVEERKGTEIIETILDRT
jgi:hypothetical protein